jgi:hypothetical protein
MIQAKQPVPPVECHPDGIEADVPSHRSLCAGVTEPSGGETSQASALRRSQAGQWLDGGFEARPTGVAPPGLDLGENEGSPVIGDQVYLSVAGADVAGDDLEAEADEMGGGKLLADPSEGVW